MRTLTAFIISIIVSFQATGQLPKDVFEPGDSTIDRKVDSLYNALTSKERIAQMLFVAAGEYGRTTTEVEQLAREHKIGGIIYLGGTAKEFKAIGAKAKMANEGFVLGWNLKLSKQTMNLEPR